MTARTPAHTTIGILGAGRVGTAVARQALAAGYPVLLSASGPAEDIQLIVDVVAPGARAVTAEEAAASADLVVAAIPLHKFRTLPREALAGKIVIDAMNHWGPVDGPLTEYDEDPRSTSEIVQEFLDRSRLVKTLNHIGYHELEEDGRPAGSPARRALAHASDNAEASERVAEFLDALGYDPVSAGPLRAGQAFAPGTPIFAGSFTAPELASALEDARVATEVATEVAALPTAGDTTADRSYTLTA
ncbi:NAD(P)-binding domain-containing protein [Klugiella xanthotipulae]|uniref:Pyrroline-5-carboxylate reductase catalytic N-terminal domain-containing protein n=1 Tax=Klugiella xanthotipulae TaxID=244735 RepID=A0A543HYZ1_9MICO|nr:NAD(P)-binding domain-containing protein [Klugiella xanthotipulae]TQM63562.1 hypothetical protein FB466_1828 [Klugiella xanthotipulae]